MSFLNAARFFLFVSTSRVTGKAKMKMNERSQYVDGRLKLRNGNPNSLAAAANTRLASKIASPVRGMIGENHICPLAGSGLMAERAPIENIARLGIPNCGLWAFFRFSGVRGSLLFFAFLNFRASL